MDGRERSAMPCIHRLQQVIAALVAYLAHDDAIWTMTQRSSQKLAGSHGDLPGDFIHSLPANSVGMCNLQFGGLLYDEQAFLLGNVVKECFQQGRLTRSRSAADDAVLLVSNEADNCIPNLLR